MATKSPRSPGSQFTSKGVVQGTALTDPVDGQPVAVIQDNAGVHRLAVDANLTADNVTVQTDDLTATDDAVRVEDPNTGAHVRVESDGSVNANIHTSAFASTPDSELIVGTEDGTPTGAKHVIKVNPDGSLAVVVSTSPFSGNVVSVFNEISAVASGATVAITTYTCPVGKTALLARINAGGTNIATYTVKVNGVNFDRKRTYFSGPFDANFDYTDAPSAGYTLHPGDQVVVYVNNFRPDSADFEARIQVNEV